MRTALLTAAALIIVGCNSEPTAPPSQHDQDAERVAVAIKHGYKVTNQNGETLYCRSDFATASHIQKNTVCLTAQQIDDLDQQNQRTFDQPSRGAANGLPPMH